MRDITAVIRMILSEIPESEKSLVLQLESLLSSAMYSAPELRGERWTQLAGILNNNIPEIKEDWHKRIETILAGEQ